MGKLIKTICGLFFILCLTSKSYASPEGMAKYPWMLMNVPIWCGPLKDVNEALKNEGYVAVEVAFGRANGVPDGDIAYAVTTYASKDTPGNILRTIETPDQVDKCILNMLFDYKALEFKPSTNL
tara:strand:+ start:773 stop:1144 length:372 start_codon:yes stop_codon:yes gene_type:complete